MRSQKDAYEDFINQGGIDLLRKWAEDGATNDQIAGMIGIHRATFYRWIKRSGDIRDALKKGKEIADCQVENALYKTALAGNVTAMIFWLKNRRPDKWRERRASVVTVAPDDGFIEALKGNAPKEKSADIEE